MSELIVIDGKELTVVNSTVGKLQDAQGNTIYSTEVMNNSVKVASTHGLRTCGSLDALFSAVVYDLNVGGAVKPAVKTYDMFNAAVLLGYLIPIVRYTRSGSKSKAKHGRGDNKWEGLGYAKGPNTPTEHVVEITLHSTKELTESGSLSLLYKHSIAFSGSPETLKWLDVTAMSEITDAAIKYAQIRYEDEQIAKQRKRDDARRHKQAEKRIGGTK